MVRSYLVFSAIGGIYIVSGSCDLSCNHSQKYSDNTNEFSDNYSDNQGCNREVFDPQMRDKQADWARYRPYLSTDQRIGLRITGM